MSSKRLLIAKITTAHGIKGLVKLHYYGEDINDVAAYNPFYTSETGHDTVMIHVKNAIKNGYVAEVEGVNNRNKAEELRNTLLYIGEEKIIAPQNGEYLQKDLIGCTIFENDQKIGIVTAIDNFGAGDLLDIKPAIGDTFYLPFKDEFVHDVDIEKKQIFVTIPEGLIE